MGDDSLNAEAFSQFAPTGALRIGVNLANPAVVRRSADKELAGPAINLAKFLADRTGLAPLFVEFPSAGAMFDAIDQRLWDIAFLAIDQTRAEKVHFSQPYLTIGAAYAVLKTSQIIDASQIDQQDLLVGLSRNAAYSLYLERTLKHAGWIEYPTPKVSFDALIEGEIDAVAGVQQALEAHFGDRCGLAEVRILNPPFLEISQAVAIPRNRSSIAANIDSLINEYLVNLNENVDVEA